jgi:hypothetical protein
MLTAGCALLQAQAITEYGAATGSAAATATAAGAGKSAGGVFGKVGKLLAGEAKANDEGQPPSPNGPRPAAAVMVAPKQSSATAPSVVVAAVSAPKPAEPEQPVNLAALESGMDRADMLKKVGKPSMSLSVPESATLVETCWYKNGADSVTVTLRDGKVSGISGLQKSAAK